MNPILLNCVSWRAGALVGLFCAILLGLNSCEKDTINASLVDPVVAVAAPKSLQVPFGPGETVLGQKLMNPYALDNVQTAASLIHKKVGTIEATHYYLKFTPQDGSQVAALEDYAELKNYELEIQPVHYQVVYEGDEGYSPLPLGEAGVVPEYVAVSASDFVAGNLPTVPYEVVEVMHIPEYETLLTFTAFVISGNEKYYDAIEGFCHPDCPSWPACLDNPQYTCIPPVGSDIKTVDPLSTEGREKFPAYILDDKLGADGDKSPLRQCLLIVNEMPSCPDKCTPVLLPLEHEPEACRWECSCEAPDGGDGGTAPTPGLVEKCGCLVYDDDKKPGGRIILEDTQLGDEGLQHVKILSTRTHWGFLYSNTDTDSNGCWKINKKYRNQNAKVKVVFRDRSSNRLTVRSWRGWRVWNVTLKPVKHKFTLRRSNRVWNDLCLRIEDTDDDQSQAEEAFIAATVNNAVHDFYDFENLVGIDDLNYLIHTQNSNWISAPMLGKLDEFNVNTPYELLGLYAYSLNLDPDVAAFLGRSLKPDVFIPFQRSPETFLALNDPFYGSDDIAQITYHETAHTAQFARLGPVWWNEYVEYILTGQLEPKICRPYGNPDRLNHGLAEVTEGHAEAMADYYADLKYGGNHSRNEKETPAITVQGRYINKAEQADFWKGNECGEFIPEGLFWDLFDENGVFPSPMQLPEIKELDRLTRVNLDKVSRVTFEDQLNALNSFIFTIDDFKESLRSQAILRGASDSDYSELFRAYGH